MGHLSHVLSCTRKIRSKLYGSSWDAKVMCNGLVKAIFVLHSAMRISGCHVATACSLNGTTICWWQSQVYKRKLNRFQLFNRLLNSWSWKLTRGDYALLKHLTLYFPLVYTKIQLKNKYIFSRVFCNQISIKNI